MQDLTSGSAGSSDDTSLIRETRGHTTIGDTKSSAPECQSDGPGRDDFLWLEEIEGQRALAWVRAQNARTLAVLQAEPGFQAQYALAREIAEAQDRLVAPAIRGEFVDQFWQDETHVRGLWRRMSLKAWCAGSTDWAILLDLDALSRQEGRNWVWQGASSLPPHHDLALIALSDGGKDAAEVREFDTTRLAFVENGFYIPEGRTRVDWIDRESVLIAHATSDACTRSGYPLTVRRLSRGESIATAPLLFAGQPTDCWVFPSVLRGKTGEARALLAERGVSFHETERWLLGDESGPRRLHLPLRSTVRSFLDDQLIFTLEHDWEIAEKRHPVGALMSVDLAEFAERPETATPTLLRAPAPRSAIEGVAATKSRLLVVAYDDLRPTLLAFCREANGWKHASILLPETSNLGLVTASVDDDKALVCSQDFLTPKTLYLIDAVSGDAEVVASALPRFDANKLAVETLTACAPDGVMVPYHIVRPKDPQESNGPILMHAYGGFGASLHPTYDPLLGKLWLERGATFVLAAIRGGGELGTDWFEAARGLNRQIGFDDFIAVARDLVRRGLAEPRRLGAIGGSNGGLLVAAAMTQQPDLFGAAVVQVPLTDMLRYPLLLAGPNWVGEYGDPASKEGANFWGRVSPYHALRADRAYPEPLFVTSTKDDRVHPGHARRMAARMEALNLPFLYLEDEVGGHSHGVDPRHTARRRTLEFAYLWRRLGA